MANKALVGEKVGMTQVWDDDNRVVPVTVVRSLRCRVVQVKTTASDGYTALQVTYGEKEAQKLNQPEAGHFAKAGVDPGVRLVELRLDDVDGYEVGQEIAADLFAAGDRIDVTAVSKGKGFAGVMKRHNFKGQKASPRHPPRPPHARLHRRLRHPGPRVQGHPDGRSHGRREGHHPEPHGRRGRRRAGPASSCGAPCPAPRAAWSSCATP